MIAQQEQLSNQLQETGWHILNREVDNLEWWAKEIWIVESEWSPQGLRLYLTFLVDPQDENHVWAIETSCKKPNDRLEAAGKPLIPLRPKWERRLSEFISALMKIRTNVKNTTQV